MNASVNPTTLLWAVDRPNPHHADATWIARIRRGDENAARSLIRHLYPTVIRWVRICLLHSDREEDIIRSVLVKLLRNPGQAKRYACWEHWASHCTVRICIQEGDLGRGSRTDRSLALNQDEKTFLGHLTASCEPWQSPDGVMARGLLEKILTALPLDQSLVLRLFRLEGWSYREISRWTGWPVWLVWWKVFRASRKAHTQWRIWIEESR